MVKFGGALGGAWGVGGQLVKEGREQYTKALQHAKGLHPHLTHSGNTPPVSCPHTHTRTPTYTRTHAHTHPRTHPHAPARFWPSRNLVKPWGVAPPPLGAALNPKP